jgi:hypothetical protein
LTPVGWQSHRSQGVAQGLQIGPPPGEALAKAGHAQKLELLLGGEQLIYCQLICRLVHCLVYLLFYLRVYLLIYFMVYWLI